MKRTTLTICILAGLATATSCRRSNIGDREANRITIHSSLTGANPSKALADPTKELTGIEMLRKDATAADLTTLSFADVTPLEAKRAAGDNAEIEFVQNQQYDIENGYSSYFVGYHPAGVLDEATDVVTWTPDGATDVLVSEFYNAGKAISPSTAPMEFNHVLARVEIVLRAKAGLTLADVQEVWGTITGVGIDDIPTTLTYDYATNKVKAGSKMGQVELLNGSSYTVGATNDGVIGASDNEVVKFASMVVPVDRSDLEIRLVNTTASGVGESRLSATINQKVVAGKVHRLTVTFGIDPDDIKVSSSAILDWDDDGSEGGGVFPDPPFADDKWILIDGVKWATGNLVAYTSVTPGSGVATGTKGTKVIIGKPTDGGLYFQFGSLIGYKGGNAASGGRGTGIPNWATAISGNGSFWNGAAYSWLNDAMVWPQAYTNGAATWPAEGKTTNDYYFGLGADPYDKMGQKLSAYTNWESGGLVTTDIAVGDPCRYYLGGGWRMPTAEDWGKLFNSVYANGPVGGAWPGAGQNWVYGTATKTVMAGIPNGINSPTEGIGIYANTAATTEADAKADPGALFFPASGYRHYSTGSFNSVGRFGYYWSGSVYTATNGFHLSFSTTYVYPQNGNYRSFGFPVRCVSAVALSSDKAENTAPAAAGSFTVTVVGADGEGWTLRETADASGAFTPSATSGTGDGTFTVAVTANTAETPREASYTLSTASGLTATITLKQKRVMPANTIEAGGLFWATGNLVADASVTPGSGVPTNTNGSMVTVGKPTDGGLYFQFGSLIGYKGGNAASKGTGRGIPHGATTTDPMPNDKWWNQGTAYSWLNDAMVWPQAYTNGAAAWPVNQTTNNYYFGLGADPYDKKGQKLSAYTNWESGGLVNQSIAVGDPCRYYLGGGWRMPTAEDWGKLFNSRYANGPVGGTWPGESKNWGYGTGTKTVMAGILSSLSPTEGKGIYANTAATTEADAKADPGALFFPASGYRNTRDGSFNDVGCRGYYWSGSVCSATSGFTLLFYTTNFSPQNYYSRAYGFPVRCVSEP